MNRPHVHHEDRLRIDNYLSEQTPSTIAEDVRIGLSQAQKELPAKYFYDNRGSELFDRICDLEEYYPTRTEYALLERVAEPVLSQVRPRDLVEFGSGAARKIRVLLDAADKLHLPIRYIPFDVSSGMLERSAQALLASYPRLKIHGVVGDYDHHLHCLPEGGPRLFLYLGGTIGNFSPAAAVDFLTRVAEVMGPKDRLLLGTDLVKSPHRLHAAYNDSQGITAAFNLNVLHVINRELDADFIPEEFEHYAFYNEEASQIEMHLRARRAMEVTIGGIGLTIHLEKGETIRTEISRKFTRQKVASMLESAGLELQEWMVPDDSSFALSLAAPIESR